MSSADNEAHSHPFSGHYSWSDFEKFVSMAQARAGSEKNSPRGEGPNPKQARTLAGVPNPVPMEGIAEPPAAAAAAAATPKKVDLKDIIGKANTEVDAIVKKIVPERSPGESFMPADELQRALLFYNKHNPASAKDDLVVNDPQRANDDVYALVAGLIDKYDMKSRYEVHPRLGRVLSDRNRKYYSTVQLLTGGPLEHIDDNDLGAIASMYRNVTVSLRKNRDSMDDGSRTALLGSAATLKKWMDRAMLNNAAALNAFYGLGMENFVSGAAAASVAVRIRNRYNEKLAEKATQESKNIVKTIADVTGLSTSTKQRATTASRSRFSDANPSVVTLLVGREQPGNYRMPSGKRTERVPFTAIYNRAYFTPSVKYERLVRRAREPGMDPDKMVIASSIADVANKYSPMVLKQCLISESSKKDRFGVPMCPTCPIPSSDLVVISKGDDDELLYFLNNFKPIEVTTPWETKVNYISQYSMHTQSEHNTSAFNGHVLAYMVGYGSDDYIKARCNDSFANPACNNSLTPRTVYVPCYIQSDGKTCEITSVTDVWSPDAARMLFKTQSDTYLNGKLSFVSSCIDMPHGRTHTKPDLCAIYMLPIKNVLEGNRWEPDFTADTLCRGYRMERFLYTLSGGCGFVWQATSACLKDSKYEEDLKANPDEKVGPTVITDKIVTIVFFSRPMLLESNPVFSGSKTAQLYPMAAFNVVALDGECWRACVYEMTDGSLGSLVRQPNVDWQSCMSEYVSPEQIAAVDRIPSDKDEIGIFCMSKEQQDAALVTVYPQLAFSRFYRPQVDLTVMWSRIRTAICTLGPMCDIIEDFTRLYKPIDDVLISPDSFVYSSRGANFMDPLAFRQLRNKTRESFFTHENFVDTFMTYGWNKKYTIKFLPIASSSVGNGQHYFWRKRNAGMQQPLRLVEGRIPTQDFPNGTPDDEFTPLWAVHELKVQKLGQLELKMLRKQAAYAQVINVLWYEAIRMGICSVPSGVPVADDGASAIGKIMFDHSAQAGDPALYCCHFPCNSTFGTGQYFVPFGPILQRLDGQSSYYAHFLKDLSDAMIDAAKLSGECLKITEKKEFHDELHTKLTSIVNFLTIFMRISEDFKVLQSLSNHMFVPRSINQYSAGYQYDPTALM